MLRTCARPGDSGLLATPPFRGLTDLQADAIGMSSACTAGKETVLVTPTANGKTAVFLSAEVLARQLFAVEPGACALAL